MKLNVSRQTLVLLLTLVVLALPPVFAGLYLYEKHQALEDLLSDLEPRFARLLGLAQSKSELAQAEEHVKTIMADYAYPDSQDASQTGNDAQQRIRTLFAQAGVDVTASQIAQPKHDKEFDRIGVNVRVEGELAAIQSAMVVLAGAKPAILVDGFTLQVNGVPKPDVIQRLTGQFNLYVLRGRP